MEDVVNTDNNVQDVGEIKIAEDVVQVIAGLAVGEVHGVAVVNSLTDGFVEKFVKKNYGKGIRIEMEGQNVSIDVHVVVDYGVKIPDAAWELQETVKKNIETITDLTVLKVNIFVEGINIEKEPKPEPPKKSAPKKNTGKEEKTESKEEASIDIDIGDTEDDE
jgi:uncharacterized alkaline shock family protein YloU